MCAFDCSTKTSSVIRPERWRACSTLLASRRRWGYSPVPSVNSTLRAALGLHASVHCGDHRHVNGPWHAGHIALVLALVVSLYGARNGRRDWSIRGVALSTALREC